MAEQHLPSYEVDFNSKVQQLRDIAARFDRARRHYFNSRVQRFRDIAERFEDLTKERIRFYRIRQRLTARIERLTKKLINFAKIAESCEEVSGIVPNELARDAAYKKFQSDLLERDFEKNGRSQILYFHPNSAKVRMTPDWLKRTIETHRDQTTINSQYLAHCWVPPEFCDRFFAKHRIQPCPERFEPKCPTPPTTTEPPVSQALKAEPVIGEGVGHSGSDAVRKRRFGPEPGKVRRYEAGDRELFSELERIMAEKQKSRSAAALELAEAGRIKGHGTAQSRATRLAALHNRDRGGTGQARGQEDAADHSGSRADMKSKPK
jgi:hypothetical protein